MEEPQQLEGTFSDHGINDVAVGVELYEAMRISAEDMILAKQLDRFKEIAGFTNEFNEILPGIRMAMQKKPLDVDAIDFIHTFVRLQKKRLDARRALATVEDELAFYE